MESRHQNLIFFSKTLYDQKRILFGIIYQKTLQY